MNNIEIREKLIALALSIHSTVKYLEFTESIQDTDLSDGKEKAIQALEIAEEILQHF